MGTCGSKFCGCFRLPSLDCRLPEEKLVISKSPPPTDPVLTSHDDDHFDAKLFTSSSSSLSCNSTTAATTATTTTTTTTASSPSSSSSSISINSDIVVLDLEMPPADDEMPAKTAIGCRPQGPAPPAKAAGVAAKQPMSRAPRAPVQVKRQRSTSPAVRAGPRSYRVEKTAPPRRSSNSPLPHGGSGSSALHGRRRCQACSREGSDGAPRRFAATARKERVLRAARPRVSAVPKGSSVEPAAACAQQHVNDDVVHLHQEVMHHSEVVQSAAAGRGETLSTVLISEELNNPPISMDCFIFL